MAVGTDLSGQVALVTGCGRSKGMGRAIALRLAHAGADLAVTDLQPEGVKNAGEPEAVGDGGAQSYDLRTLVTEIQSLGRQATAITGDIGSPEDSQAMVDEAIASLGKVDILVNNASAPHGADRGMTWDIPESAFDSVMRTNAKGVFLMSTAVIRHLLARSAPGRVINIASVAGKVGVPFRSVYSASKFAVVGLTQVMALELAKSGITVNAVCPGAIATDRNAATLNRARSSGDTAATSAAASPVGRVGNPHDIARAVLFLADPMADYITGQSLVVDGGSYMV